MISDVAKKHWEKFSQYKTFEDLEKILNISWAIGPGEIELLIPSIQIRAEGPALVGIFYLTKTLLVEVNDATRGNSFDFIGRFKLQNLRINLSEQSIKNAAGEAISYQIAEVIIRHSGNAGSTFSYAGNDRDGWIALVKEAFPINLLEWQKP